MILEVVLNIGPRKLFYYENNNIIYFIVADNNTFEVYELIKKHTGQLDYNLIASDEMAGKIALLSGNSKYIYIPQYIISPERSWIDVLEVGEEKFIKRIEIPEEYGICTRVVVNDDTQYILLCEKGFIIGDLNKGYQIEKYKSKECKGVDLCGDDIYIESSNGCLYKIKGK